MSPEERLLRRLTEGLDEYVDAALSRLGDNITQLGTGYTYYWYISAARGLLKTMTTRSDVRVEQKFAVDEVIKQYYKVLALQENASSPSAKEACRKIYGVGCIHCFGRFAILTIHSCSTTMQM